MQIAQVVPKTKTQKEAIFDYAIPPEILPQIKPGILVEVPFHGRKLPGIVLKLSRFTHLRKNLKEIIKIIDPLPVIDETHIQLAKWMSDYYSTSLGKTLFENVTPPSLRIIKQFNSADSRILAVRTSKKRSKQAQTKYSKKYLIVANFQERMAFYLQAIQKTVAQKKQVIIIVPDLSVIPFFTKHFKQSYAIIHSGLTLKERFIQWHKIRSGKVDLAIGSISALFSPLPNLGLIIIDQEENETYKNDRNPRFHTIKVAEILCKLTGVNLVIGSITPRIETYYQALKNRYILKKPLPKMAKPLNTIINMSSERQIFSLPLQKEIDQQLLKKQKILLVFNRKGEGQNLSCSDCKWIYLCPQCGLPLIPQNQEATCFHCEKSFKIPEKCPKCRNTHLKPFGLGTKRLEKFIHDFWPQVKTLRIEQNQKINPHSTSWDIAITTSYGLKFNFPSIGLVAILDADQGLNFPDFRTAEKNFQIFFKFLKIGDRGIIQTRLPESHFISALSQMDYEKFFLEELSIRQKYRFPPFSQLIRLLIKNTDDTEAKKESQKIFLSLNERYGRQKFLEFLGPSPAFLKKQRTKFIWQIIIKIKPNQDPKILDEFKKYLQEIGRDIIIDVDPISLL